MGRQSNRTRIIATLGPATAQREVIRELIRGGVDCFRINFSHVTGPDAQPLIDLVRQCSDELGQHIPVLADIQGPKLRVGHIPDGGVLLRDGRRFTLTGRTVEATDEIATSQYENLADDVKPGTAILLADGIIELVVEEVVGRDVHCKVISGGRLYSNKGLNIPRTKLSVETLTAKDRRDLQWIAVSDVDIVALSFVRSPGDIRTARELLGAESRIPVMAKLELPEVLERLNEIIETSDGVMVARGDLAVEVPFEEVPQLQKQILERAAARGKWAVVATQMLGSMVLQPRPTRAEVSDVANAVLDGADAIMLSEETATGKHPVTAVKALRRICIAAEQMLPSSSHLVEASIASFAAGAANAAVSAADRLRARAIVALAGSGPTALALTKWRPRIPVIALSPDGPRLRRLNVLRGVTPVRLQEKMSMEQQIAVADSVLLERGWATPGEITVVVAAMPLGQGKETNTIRFHRVRTQG